MDNLLAVPELVAVIFSLLTLAIGMHLLARHSGLPFTVLLVLTGIGISQVGQTVPNLAPLTDALQISPDLILFVFLPTLIFESSYTLDARQLRHNLVPILTLAIPGLLLSTALIGLILWQVLAIDLLAALLLGAILSATDPVAVIALFRQLGAPARLTTLIEGESLFNDATALVLSKILLGILAAGTLTEHALGAGILDFGLLFGGGLLFGVVLGYLVSQLIGWLEADPIVEIGLTTLVAYLGFLIAEELLHVSGVMATLGAGLLLGTWGRLRISASVRVYLEHFWTVLAFTANAFLFLLLGMQVDLSALAAAWHLVLWVILALLVSRAVVIFALLPLTARLPKVEPISRLHRFIMFWGGLRGAIALAIVLSLPEGPYKELFVALVTGAVLFTLLVQGLTVHPLIRWFGLDQLPLADRLALLESDLVAHQHALQRLPALQQGGLFSSHVAHRLALNNHQAIRHTRQRLRQLRRHQLSPDQEFNLFFLRALAEEKACYLEMFEQGHLSEGTVRRLLASLEQQTDTLRHDGELNQLTGHRQYEDLEHWLYRRLGRTPWLTPLIERVRIARIGHYYEMIWGHFQGSHRVLHSLERLAQLESTPPQIVHRVLDHYRQWNRQAKDKLHRLNNDFPEFALLMQERLGQRIVLLAELETTREQAQLGTIPKGVADSLEARLSQRLKALRGQPLPQLHDNPAQLLARVPLLAQLPPAQIALLAEHCTPLTLDKHEYLLREGDAVTGLYMISRGTLELRLHNGAEQASTLSTLIAGDAFGESALLGEAHVPDLAVIAHTPVHLYLLEHSTLQQLLTEHPELHDYLQRREAELTAILQHTAPL